jgi:hypothetical protein
MITVTGWVVNQTEKAIFFLWDRGREWRPICLPKSQVTVTIGEWFDVLVLPRWLAERNGIRQVPTLVENWKPHKQAII